MCGIAGYIGPRRIEPGAIGRTLGLMKNRGPDHQEHRRVLEGAVNVDLLHSRLSIIDLDERSNQPFKIGPATLIFNGEIYNYVELRRELRGFGVTFLTDSDTEVLLRAYLKWGGKCVEKFEGMWAFALWDERVRKLMLSRDRFAEKPLYYLRDGSGWYFGSEIKMLQALSGRRFGTNQQQVLRYLVNGYKSLYKAGETFYEEVQEVEYATNLVIDERLRVKQQRYWSPEYKPQKMSEEEAVERVRQALYESVRLRLRSDVPIAFCLSGGVDSGALVSIAAKRYGHEVAAFSIVDSDERYDELDNIMATVKDVGCEHTIIDLKPDGSMLDRLRKLINYHDGPVATITYFVHSFLSEVIASRGYKVVFSGTAADELFTGYFDHWMWHLVEMKERDDYENYLSAWQRHVQTTVLNPLLRDPGRYIKNPELRDHIFLHSDVFSSYLKVDFCEGWQEEKFCDSLLRNRMMNELFHEATRVILHEDDLNSMMYSIENRSPYLDTRLFKVAYSIPPEYLMKDGYAKHLLRLAVKGVLNDKVRLDRQKRGFNASINSIIDFKREREKEYLLSSSPVYDLVDRAKIERVMEKDKLPNSLSKFMFNFINAKMFLEQKVEEAGLSGKVNDVYELASESSRKTV